MEEFENKLLGIKDSFLWAIESKLKVGESIEIEQKCLEEIEMVLKYVSRFKRGLL